MYIENYVQLYKIQYCIIMLSIVVVYLRIIINNILEIIIYTILIFINIYTFVISFNTGDSVA